MTIAPMTKTELAAQLALQGLNIAEDDLDGMLSMARDLAESARSMRCKHEYALESLSGFSLAKTGGCSDE